MKEGHILEYLPPYSPDLNPIEKNGHKLNQYEERKDAQYMICLVNIFNMLFCIGLAI